MSEHNDVRGFLLEETNKCVFCGFCEPVCPTLSLGKHRGYGPRGRINIINRIVNGEKPTDEDVDSVFSCLVCKACDTNCPARIKITETIRLSRHYILEKLREGRDESR